MIPIYSTITLKHRRKTRRKKHIPFPAVSRFPGLSASFLYASKDTLRSSNQPRRFCVTFFNKLQQKWVCLRDSLLRRLPLLFFCEKKGHVWLFLNWIFTSSLKGFETIVGHFISGSILVDNPRNKKIHPKSRISTFWDGSGFPLPITSRRKKT